MMEKAIIYVVLIGFSSLGVCYAGNFLSVPDLGVEFRVSAEEVFVGDTFYLCVDITNPTQETYYGIPLFAIWDASPDWRRENIYYFPFPPDKPWNAGDVHYYTIDVPPGVTEVEIIPPLILRDSVGDYDGTLHLFTGMSDPFFTKIFGSTDWLDVLFHF